MAQRRTTIIYHIGGGLCMAGVAVVGVWVFPPFTSVSYSNPSPSLPPVETETVSVSEEKTLPPALILETPEEVKALYMTQCVAGTPSMRDALVALAEETEINAFIIDIKDYTGALSFKPTSEELEPYFGGHCYAPDMREFIRSVNEKGIYVIGRITVFQDPLWAADHPQFAVQKESTRGVWADNKGLHYVDVGARAFWDYIILISQEAREIGFDELNYDYVRYPSDGNMRDIYYPLSEEKVTNDPEWGKAVKVEEFFSYLYEHTRDLNIPLSADLFGMVTTNRDDLNIGQVLERALPYFDYIAPMVYPSHYPSGFNGWSNPNHYPHDIIEFSMGSAVKRTQAFKNATTTPADIKERISPDQLRPWIQDFDYGGEYGPREVRTQIEAVYDVGLDSWMIWDPSNRYTREALHTQ